MPWIKRQIAQFKTQERQAEREYVSGETLYVWGKRYYLEVCLGSKNALDLAGSKALLTVRKNSTVLQREHFVREWYRSILKLEIKRILPRWERITNLKPTGWQTKYMKTRWGTCNTVTKKIWLNVQLAKKTPECLDYVILHELIHLVEKHHNDHFKSLMDRYMPMWREIKKSLNDQILDYMEA